MLSHNQTQRQLDTLISDIAREVEESTLSELVGLYAGKPGILAFDDIPNPIQYSVKQPSIQPSKL